ncbi:MAG: hypothetical protein ROZ37_13185 [Aromatoleum sp.]|jgi:hypothetical protein|uniref:hypothetical protein n=1 Tax=Aromatoleum sp. TaxID=2307007 RepID=UPI002893A373|nr:hypothetical protein [Aromatoleum sp.]MDT3671271.1 hypothetical protein [Aromatoleum sp.]
MNVAVLPDPLAWRAAAANRPELFQTLDAGSRIGLIARTSPARMLVWHAGDEGIDVQDAPFPGFATSGVDLLLSADNEALAEIVAAVQGQLFEALRCGIRSGAVVCYMLRRRCDLEAKGYDELLEALGFAFMGACR